MTRFTIMVESWVCVAPARHGLMAARFMWCAAAGRLDCVQACMPSSPAWTPPTSQRSRQRFQRALTSQPASTVMAPEQAPRGRASQAASSVDGLVQGETHCNIHVPLS